MEGLQRRGLKHIVLCPGSRSAPLALAAGGLAEDGKIDLITAIDERSAGFFALGLSSVNAKATAVITTSGSAVAELLPSAVEADKSCLPLLFITADRPLRLKECGANQTVNQEDFLKCSCRYFVQGPLEGIHLLTPKKLNELIQIIWLEAHDFPGPVHLNLPFEEPLYPDLLDQQEVWSGWSPERPEKLNEFSYKESKPKTIKEENSDYFDLSKPGIVIVGPWRGDLEDIKSFQKSIKSFHELSGWPIFGDPLSGVNFNQAGLIRYWELLLDFLVDSKFLDLQILRLGPIPSSKKLEIWLENIKGNQVLISEGDSRNLDPLGLAIQFSKGFVTWWQEYQVHNKLIKFSSEEVDITLKKLFYYDTLVEEWLNQRLLLKGQVNEPALAFWVPRLLPSEFPLMLAASSPVRDYLTFSGLGNLNRHVFSFRGASGIDGTISLAVGISIAIKRLFLVTGDLSFLHDSNGLLLCSSKRPSLVILLVDNGGGGIFNSFPLKSLPKGDFEQLFAMPQKVDQLAIAKAHEIPYRQVSCLEDFEDAIEWSISQNGPALIRVCTIAKYDSTLRKDLREDLTNFLHSKFK